MKDEKKDRARTSARSTPPPRGRATIPPSVTGSPPPAPPPPPAAPLPPTKRGKYLLLDVPDFTEAAGDAPRMRSYLRLGAADPSVAGKASAVEWGEDLAVRARKPTRLDGVTGAFDGSETSLPYHEENIVFDDDARLRDPNDGSWSIARRRVETAALHAKGGWRDHSDGNRISTTRGDVVEVVRGNYKLVVLGRQAQLDGDGREQEDPDDLAELGAGFDASGGEIRTMGMNVGSFDTTSINWVADKGRYRVVEKNQKADTFSIHWGDVHEEFFGEWKSEITGSEDPASYPQSLADFAANPGQVNPKILSRTWAERIEEYTGSAKRRVPSIQSETWAEKVDELTDVLHGMTSKTRVAGGVAEALTVGAGTVSATTVGGGVVESLTVGLGTASSTLVAGGTLESTIVGLGTASLTMVGVNTADLTVVGVNTAELTVVGGSADSMSVIAQRNELTVGNTMALTIGDKVEGTIGNLVSATLGQVNEIYVGQKNTLDIAALVEIFLGFKCSIMLGPYIDIKLQEADLVTEKTTLGAKLSQMGFKVDQG